MFGAWNWRQIIEVPFQRLVQCVRSTLCIKVNDSSRTDTGKFIKSEWTLVFTHCTCSFLSFCHLWNFSPKWILNFKEEIVLVLFCHRWSDRNLEPDLYSLSTLVCLVAIQFETFIPSQIANDKVFSVLSFHSMHDFSFAAFLLDCPVRTLAFERIRLPLFYLHFGKVCKKW